MQNIAEIAGMEGEIITTRELFAFQYRGERLDGGIEGSFESTRMRPDFICSRGALRPRKELLDALGIGGDLNCSIQFCSSRFSARRFCSAARFFGCCALERRRAYLEPRLNRDRHERAQC